MSEIHAFFLLPASTPSSVFLSNDDLLDSEKLRQFIIEFEHLVESAYSEKSTSVWYDCENINDFLSNFEGLHDEYLTNLTVRLRNLLTNALDWRNEQQHTLDNRYFLWDLMNEQVVPLYHRPHTLSEIAERTMRMVENKHVLINVQALNINRKVLAIIKDNWRDSVLPKLIIIPFVSNAEKLDEWFKSNRQKRIFHLHKHGEYGEHVQQNKGEEVSPLLCGKEDAQRLLENAIGDQRISKKLYAFDENHQKYIVFEDENTLENSYHGYHIDDEYKIPENIRKKIQR